MVATGTVVIIKVATCANVKKKAKGKKIKVFNVEKMWGLGTPEDLNTFLTKYTGDF